MGKCGLDGWCGRCGCRIGQWMYECSGGVRDVSAIEVCGVRVHIAGCSRPHASADALVFPTGCSCRSTA